MTQRIQLNRRASEPYQQLLQLRLAETQDVPGEVYAQATAVFTEDQYRAVAWAITVINAFNRLGVTSRLKLPPEPQ